MIVDPSSIRVLVLTPFRGRSYLQSRCPFTLLCISLCSFVNTLITELVLANILCILHDHTTLVLFFEVLDITEFWRMICMYFVSWMPRNVCLDMYALGGYQTHHKTATVIKRYHLQSGTVVPCLISFISYTQIKVSDSDIKACVHPIICIAGKGSYMSIPDILSRCAFRIIPKYFLLSCCCCAQGWRFVRALLKLEYKYFAGVVQTWSCKNCRSYAGDFS